MPSSRHAASFILGLFVFLGLLALGYQLGDAAIRIKDYERSVRVKGLSEREYKADIVIWPIRFTVAGNDLSELYTAIESGTASIRAFLEANGFAAQEITVGAPIIIDKSAQQYGNAPRAEFRYTANQVVTVYTGNVDAARDAMTRLSKLGKQGIVLSGGDHRGQTEFLFTRLNDVKPEMVEEATRQARVVAEKFAADSQSTLGKIKRASQGQFSISDRDRNTPHIKKVRVVSTIEYYLSD
jgi:hypothetical protein